MFLSTNKKASKILIIVSLFSICLPLSSAFAEDPIPVRDDEVRTNTRSIDTTLKQRLKEIVQNTQKLITNTQKIIDNTQKIADILTGTLPGAQYDSIRARTELAKERIALQNMTNNIVNFSNSSFDGDPAFVTNTGLYLRNIENNEINNFLTDNTALDSLPNSTQIKQSISNQYIAFNKKIEPKITDQAKTDKLKTGDFTDPKSWDTWLEMVTIPQNNPQGQIVIAQEEIDRRINDAQEAVKLEATWGNGFKSWKSCDPSTANPDMNYDGCIIQTPGSVIANKVNWADTSNQRVMETANDFNNITYVLNEKVKYTDLGSVSVNAGGLLSSNIPNINTDDPEILAQINQQYQDYISTITPPSPGPGPGPGPVDSGVSQFYSSDGTTLLPRTNILAIIDSYIQTERDFLSAINNIGDLFNATINAISGSADCSATNKSLFTSVIDGTYTGAELPYNVNKYNADKTKTTSNIDFLTPLRASIASASDAQVPGLLTTFASHSEQYTNKNDVPLYVGPSGHNYTVITSAVKQVADYFATLSCNINRGSLSAWGI